MRIALPALLLVLMGAAPCTVTSDNTEVAWSGWVLSDLPADEGNLVLETGAMEMTLPDGTPLGEATPSESRPGFFSLDVASDIEVGLRITGETVHPTIWRTRTPRADGFWLFGALFAVDMINLDLTLNQLEEMTGTEIPWREAQDGVLIYGTPTIRDAADEAAWTGAQLTALDGEGAMGEVIAIAQDPETGLTGLAASPSGLLGANQVAGPTILFIAHDLAPGPVRLIVEASDGRTMVADWVSQDGDVLSAFHLALPESD